VEVEFQEERADGTGSCRLARESEENVSIFVEKVDEVLRA
jgi:hypothetical protein